jgi:hypothetical protein
LTNDNRSAIDIVLMLPGEMTYHVSSICSIPQPPPGNTFELVASAQLYETTEEV